MCSGTSTTKKFCNRKICFCLFSSLWSTILNKLFKSSSWSRIGIRILIMIWIWSKLTDSFGDGSTTLPRKDNVINISAVFFLHQHFKYRFHTYVMLLPIATPDYCPIGIIWIYFLALVFGSRISLKGEYGQQFLPGLNGDIVTTSSLS
jgi:hypothetical protein